MDVVCCLVGVVFFFKQKTAYEVRISDWSSDVCSSDLFIDAITQDDSLILAAVKALGFYALGFFFFLQIPGMAAGLGGGGASLASQFANAATGGIEIGRATCRARVCQYV